MSDLRHRATRMAGRDPDERHRAATPLELLFDLTFVVAFGTAANELAHALAEDQVRVGVGGFCFVTFAISWAWINFSWFASAYDTDDWVHRLITMVQMVGVLVLALGLPDLFDSLEHHSALHELGTTLSVAAPLLVYVVVLYALYAHLSHTHDPFHWVLIAGSLVVIAAAVLLAAAGASVAVALTVLALTPWVTVAGYELVGHRHNEEVLADL